MGTKSRARDGSVVYSRVLPAEKKLIDRAAEVEELAGALNVQVDAITNVGDVA